MQTSDRLRTAAETATNTIMQAARTLWGACLAEAESSLNFASQATGGGTGPSRRTRQQRDEINQRAAATSKNRGNAKPLGDQVLAYLKTHPGIATEAVKIAGYRPGVIASTLGRLGKTGAIEQRDGLWYIAQARAEQKAA